EVEGVVDLGIDEAACGRAVAAGVGIERGFTHKAVHAGLCAQVAIRIVTGDFDGGALDASDFACRLLQDFYLVAFALTVANVHPQQHGRPVLRLGAAASRLNVDEARVGIHRVVKHPTELQIAYRAL